MDLPPVAPLMRRQTSTYDYFSSNARKVLRKCREIFAPKAFKNSQLTTSGSDDGKAKCAALAVVRAVATTVQVGY